MGDRSSRITLRNVGLVSAICIAVIVAVALSIYFGVNNGSTSQGTGITNAFIDGTPSNGTLNVLKRIGKVDREYLLRTPTGYNKANKYKLVFFFHGWTGSSAEFVPKVNELADADKFIIVAPHGYNDGVADNYPSWRFSGAWSGVSSNGAEPVCDVSLTEPNYTYKGCTCKNR